MKKVDAHLGPCVISVKMVKVEGHLIGSLIRLCQLTFICSKSTIEIVEKSVK